MVLYQMDLQSFSDGVSHRGAGGTAPEGGVLSVQAEPGVMPLVFGCRLQRAVEAEGVEERHQEQEAHDAEDDDYEDGVNVCVHVL